MKKPSALLGAAISAAILFTSLWSAPTFASAPGAGRDARSTTSQAVVVVDTGSTVKVRLISFAADSISGLDALRLAGASPETIGYSAQGTAVCRLFGIGNAATPSQCLGSGSDPRYWAYYRADPDAGTYRYSPVGGGATRVVSGGVEAWRFGTGSAPAFVSFCQVAGCSASPGGGASQSAAASASANSGGSGTSSGGAGLPQSASSGAGPSGAATSSQGDPAAGGSGGVGAANGSTGGDPPDAAQPTGEGIIAVRDDLVAPAAAGDGAATDPSGRSDGPEAAANGGNSSRGSEAVALGPDSARGRPRGPKSLAIFAIGLTGLIATGLYYRRIRRRQRLT